MKSKIARLFTLTTFAMVSVSALAGTKTAADLNKSYFQCLANANIVFKFSKGDKQLANVRDDEEFQRVNQRAMGRAMHYLSGLAEADLYGGMEGQLKGEARLMTDAVYQSDQNLGDDELGLRLKRYMKARFEKLGCLKP